MAPGSGRKKIKAFFSGLFPGQPVRFSPSGAESNASPNGGFFTNARNFVLENPTMIFNARGESNNITWAMKLLSQHIIPGAAHDSSAREPPPRCHPGTRIKLIERMTTWFHDKKRQKFLLWLSGPAGVGKSAVIQTFAESLATSKRLGASVFFSRPNKRNDPQRVFITVAYQLAVRIEAYRGFIAEQLAHDPDLLNKGMKEQFRCFIVEPFVEQEIGAGGEAWGVLLDGLDELDGQRPQRDIIRLISSFVREYPEVPLVWAIASRPEPHISDTFGEEDILPSYWEEFIPIDSTEACEDVERFLRSSLETIQKDFPRSVPKNWPSEADFLKLAGAASGLFVYVSVAIRFVEDSDYANPVTRLDLVLSAIDRSQDVPPEDQPFAHLDALYTQILAAIPSASWTITKRILGFTLFARDSGPTKSFEFHSKNIRAMSAALNVDQDNIYASLNKCYSVLQIPPLKSAYLKPVTFFHASFADYLTDTSRSKEFFICLDDAVEDVLQGMFRVLQDFVENFPIGAKDKWDTYCSRYHSGTSWKISRKMKRDWNDHLYLDARYAFLRVVTGAAGGSSAPQLAQSERLDLLVQFDVVDLRLSLWAYGFVRWLCKIWKESPEELTKRGLIREASLKELKFQHLDCKKLSPSYLEESSPSDYLYSPRSRQELRAYTSMFESFQKNSPELQVLIFGRIPETRYAFFFREHPGRRNAETLGIEDRHFIIPHPY